MLASEVKREGKEAKIAQMDSSSLLISKSSIWEAIDLSESLLVCGMLGDAASLSSSVLRRLRGEQWPEGEEIGRSELADMTASAAMVLVQSLKALGRTLDIFSELEGLCHSVTELPCEVIITGACMQLSEGFTSSLKPILENYLGLWKVVDGMLLGPKLCNGQLQPECCWDGPSLEEYLQLVDIYAIRLLGLALHDVDLAIAWAEKVEIPEEKRQDLLRKLHSLNTTKTSISSINEDKHGRIETIYNNSNMDASKESLEVHLANRKSSQFAKLRVLGPCFWWPRLIRMKCGHSEFALQCGKAAALGTLIILMYYILRKKWAVAQRMVASQLLSIKRVLIDAWQLAFSVQVNPLAAVQPLTASVPPGRR